MEFFPQLAAVIKQGKAIFEAENQHLPAQERERLWTQSLAEAQQPQDSTRSGIQAKERSISHPPLGPSKRAKLYHGSPYPTRVAESGCSPFNPSSMTRRASNNSASATRPSSRRVSIQQSQPASNEWVHRSNSYSKGTPHAGSDFMSIPTGQASRSTNVVEYSPADWTQTFSADSFRDTASTSTTSYNQLTPPYSASPTTDNFFDQRTDETSVGMSRGPSTSSLYGKFSNLGLAQSMSREPSTTSHYHQTDVASPLAPPALPYDSQLLAYMGGSTTDHDMSPSASFTSSLPQIIEDSIKMERSASNDSNISRISRRTNEQKIAASRQLAPASAAPSTCTSLQVHHSQPGSQSMSRQSSTGSDKVAIARAPQSRPEKQKVTCDKCKERPNGYKGPHELARHKGTAHDEKVKVFICLDRKSLTVLSDCEPCRNFKQYKADYNAASHYRRRHHNPKPKGIKRNGKIPENERRGGKGGGKEPPMSTIREDWLLSFEVDRSGRPLDARFEQYFKPDISRAESDVLSQGDAQSQGIGEQQALPTSDEFEGMLPSPVHAASDSTAHTHVSSTKAPTAIDDLTSTPTSSTTAPRYPQNIPDELFNDADSILPSSTLEDPFFTTLQPFDDLSFAFDSFDSTDMP